MQIIDTEKIKILRQKLSIPLNAAIKLVKEHNGDVSACEKAFHKTNINAICRLAECDESMAKKYYHICKGDVQKAIKKIDERLVCITTNEPNETVHKIGFILWAENQNLTQYITSKAESVFIQSKDFDYVIEEFQSVFPQKRPYKDSEIIDDCFCICSHNIFDNKTCRHIVKRIARIATDDPKVEKFLRDLIKWFNIKLRFADYIVVYGNL